MALKGELDLFETCPDCGRPVPIRVLLSGAGYYIGQQCDLDGPLNRLSRVYYGTREEAQQALETDTWPRRDTKYHPEGY